MINNLVVRESWPEDKADLEQLYAAAFPDEDLIPLVNELLIYGPDVLSLVATRDNIILGHVCFTFCQVNSGGNQVALLAPLAVNPSHQNQGLGSVIVRDGFKQLEAAHIDQVLVLGDPVYYSRFGFKAEVKILPPYPLPAEWQGAWQSVSLGEAVPSQAGKLIVPKPWQHIELWVD